jgi:hypothetical protein
MKHTPGPWWLERIGDSWGPRYKLIAQSPLNPKFNIQVALIKPRELDTSAEGAVLPFHTNAILIAWAPEMFELVRFLALVCNGAASSEQVAAVSNLVHEIIADVEADNE